MTPEHQELLGCIAIFGGLLLIAWIINTAEYYLDQLGISVRDILLYPILVVLGVWYRITK